MININYSNIIDNLNIFLQQLLHDYVYQGYSSIAHHLAYPFGIAVVLYIVIMGYAIINGVIKLSIQHFARSALK